MSTEPIGVDFIVNGTPIHIAVYPQITLADVLRLHLGLTGTHMGCEHGVCGMCTVVIDSDAVRSCLLFAVQLDGTDILTVESLDTPEDQNPLQKAFAHYHALQCGFCTPGFLMSAYDLLAHRPDVVAENLPVELSGVLRRCTGYRNIVAAVDTVARAHRGGLPEPAGRRPQLLVGRGGATRLSDGGAAGDTAPAGVGPVDEPSAADANAVRPDGPPTLTVDMATHLSAGADDVWAVLTDTPLLARCLPGAEMTEDLGGGRYRGRARVQLGPIRLAFGGSVHVVVTDPAARSLRILAAGRDQRGQTQADISSSPRSAMPQ